MTEKKLTEARRLANEILPKVQKMQRDMYLNNHVSVCIEPYSSGYSFYVVVSHMNDMKDRSENPSFEMFYFYDFYDADKNDETFERLAEYVKEKSAA